MLSRRLLLPAAALLWTAGVLPTPAAEPAPAPAPADTGIDRIIVTGGSDERVQELNPGTGTRIYRLGPETIENQGRGLDAGLDEVLLHAPGVSRESGGQYHLRGEDYGLQYRLNGIQLPEGISSSLGQPFDTRLIQNLTIIDGALPAQYGLRNAGVIDLQTKSGAELRGQETNLYGGSHNTIHPSYSAGITASRAELFVTGAYLQDDLGTDNVTADSDAIHDRTRQYQEFALATYNLAPGHKLSLIFSGTDATFEIPNEPGLPPEFEVQGFPGLDSAKLDRNQHEQNYFGIVAYQFDSPVFSLLAAEVNSYSSTHYQPDRVGDLLFTGVASDARRDLLGTGVQLDVSFRPNEAHTLRAGFALISQRERANSKNTVLPMDEDTGEVTSDVTEEFTSRERRRGYLYGLYLQDEWRIVKGLTFNYGGRFDGVNAYVHQNAFSPRVNAVWQALPSLAFHAGYAWIFTPPLLEYIPRSEFAQYVGTTNAPDTLSDPPTRSERSHAFSAGASWEAASGLTFGLDAYYKSVRNMQDEEQLGASLIFTPFTYARGYKEGIEFTADYRHAPWLLYANVALAKTEGRQINSAQGLFDEEELRYIARHDIHTDYDQLWTISAGAAYRWQGLTLHTDLLFGSGFYGGTNNEDQLPTHYTVNVGLAYTSTVLWRTLLTLRFDVVNLFDQSYLLHDAGIGATVNQYGERRGFFGGVRVDF